MHGAGVLTRQMALFAWLQARSCAFAVALLGGMAASTLLPPLPVARYDLLLLYGVLLTGVCYVLGWETRREVAVVAVCHVLGFAFELVKVHVGSWTYPEPGLAKIAGVPLYGGFMYAAVGSYVCRAWRLLDLTLTGYRARSTALVAVGLYVNFLSHHWLPDVRPAARRPAAGGDGGDLGALHDRRTSTPDAAGGGLRPDRVLPVAGREHRHLSRRLDIPLPTPRLGTGLPVQVGFLGLADQRHLRHLPGPSPPPGRAGRSAVSSPCRKTSARCRDACPRPVSPRPY